jgi:hypothetical protein
MTLAASAPAGATRAGQVCPTFTSLGLKVQWETVGTSFSCSAAKTWVVKLIADKVKQTLGRVPLTNGPKSLHCYATLETKGHASGGLCYKGTLAYPATGFTWYGT